MIKPDAQLKIFAEYASELPSGRAVPRSLFHSLDQR